MDSREGQRYHLRSLHHIAFDLQLSSHEQSLRLRLATGELAEIVVGEGKDD